MKEFLSLVNEMMGQLDARGSFDGDTLEKMPRAYQSLTEKEKQESIGILDELLGEDYRVYFYMMSALLKELKEERILAYIKEKLKDREYPLWERFSNMRQLKMMLFRNRMPHWDEEQEHRDSREIYEAVLREMQEKIGAVYPHIPYGERKKTIVITVIQILGLRHAPTKILVDFYRFFTEFGYKVKVFVCFHPGKAGLDHIFWYDAASMNNLADETTFFKYQTGKEEIEGYNLVLRPEDYLQRLRETMGMVWDEKPEFVFEVGEETMLAGVCSHFTTVVTLGITKNVPVTTAPVLASYFFYSKKEHEKYVSLLHKGQRMVDVQYWPEQNIETKTLSKKDFGISDNTFVIIVAGNRLDEELTDEFWDIIYQILEMNRQFLVLFIGICPKSREKAQKEKYWEQMLFIGSVADFRETIAIGDVFLNPPRQGGGTGGHYAILENVPVITLDNCDVAQSVGAAFICNSTEEMPPLVYRYFSDERFMQYQKAACEKKTGERMKVDGYGNMQRMFEVVRETAGKEEENGW